MTAAGRITGGAEGLGADGAGLSGGAAAGCCGRLILPVSSIILRSAGPMYMPPAGVGTELTAGRPSGGVFVAADSIILRSAGPMCMPPAGVGVGVGVGFGVAGAGAITGMAARAVRSDR